MTRVRGAVCLVALLAEASLGAAAERHVEVAPGEGLRVVEAGRGTPVVLIPGLMGSAFGFRRLVPPLVDKGYRVIVIEPLGIGGSAKPDHGDYSLTAQADRIARVLDVLGVDKTVVAAHSVGASMAFRLAYRHPGRVKGIVSLEGGPTEAAATPGFRRAMRFSFLIKLFGGRGRLREIVRSSLVERSADPRWVTGEVVDGYLAAGLGDLDGALGAFRQMAKAREPEPLGPRLSEVRCPVRLVLGMAPHEGGVREAELRLLEERLPDFTLVRVEKAGHFLFEEDPAAVVAAIDSPWPAAPHSVRSRDVRLPRHTDPAR